MNPWRRIRGILSGDGWRNTGEEILGDTVSAQQDKGRRGYGRATTEGEEGRRGEMAESGHHWGGHISSGGERFWRSLGLRCSPKVNFTTNLLKISELA
jgi:hypothetical protein